MKAFLDEISALAKTRNEEAGKSQAASLLKYKTDAWNTLLVYGKALSDDFHVDLAATKEDVAAAVKTDFNLESLSSIIDTTPVTGPASDGATSAREESGKNLFGLVQTWKEVTNPSTPSPADKKGEFRRQADFVHAVFESIHGRLSDAFHAGFRTTAEDEFRDFLPNPTEQNIQIGGHVPSFLHVGSEKSGKEGVELAALTARQAMLLKSDYVLEKTLKSLSGIKPIIEMNIEHMVYSWDSLRLPDFRWIGPLDKPREAFWTRLMENAQRELETIKATDKTVTFQAQVGLPLTGELRDLLSQKDGSECAIKNKIGGKQIHTSVPETTEALFQEIAAIVNPCPSLPPKSS